MLILSNQRSCLNLEMKVAQTWGSGFGVLHFLMLQTVLNEKLTFPHFGQVQSLSRVTSAGVYKTNSCNLIHEEGASCQTMGQISKAA